ncbi:uncharacterized protein PRCAT00003929001 [Priceomyces carsonii]|uniref:uncharacterized protein n=1 Tax=Priceomyces carsonii TaxID=28549 RepID=UPI002EDB742B|nr:unnamed protein product [Priceomyces carsonii]
MINDDDNGLIFASMGMFIIDENHYPDSRENDVDIVGGGGPYALAGARIIVGPKLSNKLSAIIDMGSDFPHSVEDELKQWNTSIFFRSDPHRLTTRGMNIYDKNGVRHFKYIAPKKRIESSDILGNMALRTSKTIHLLCSFDRCEEIVTKILQKVELKPIFIFEPLPDDCKPENLLKLERVLKNIDIFTPNLNEGAELAGFLKLPKNSAELEQLASVFKPYLTLKNSGVVLRCGEMGCYIKSQDKSILMPAYHSDQAQVVDITGGGNSYCGGFVVGFYLSKGDWLVGGLCGNIASGCIIEKLGQPSLSLSESKELWNGLATQTRFDTYINANRGLFENFDKSKIDWL